MRRVSAASPPINSNAEVKTKQKSKGLAPVKRATAVVTVIHGDGPKWGWDKSAHIPLPRFPSDTIGGLASAAIAHLQYYLREWFPGLSFLSVVVDDDIHNSLAAELVHSLRYWWLYHDRGNIYLKSMGEALENESKAMPHCNVASAVNIIKWSMKNPPEWVQEQHRYMIATVPPSFEEWKARSSIKLHSDDKEMASIESDHLAGSFKDYSTIKLFTIEAKARYNRDKKKSDPDDYYLCAVPINSDACIVRNCPNQALLPMLWSRMNAKIPDGIKENIRSCHQIDACYRIYALRGRCIECSTLLASLGSIDVGDHRCYITDSPFSR